MKKLYIIIISVLVIFVGILSYYKFFYNQDKKQNNDLIIVLKDEKKEIYRENNDEITYKDKIITELITNYNYELETESGNVTGKIFIGTDKYLYITDTKKNISYKVSDTKVTTMKVANEENRNILALYLISEDGKLLIAELSDIDIKNISVRVHFTKCRIKNFANIEFKGNSTFFNSRLMVLAEDGYIYDAFSEAKYDESVILLDNMYYIYSDNTIANSYGNMLKDFNGNYYKIKYYVEFLDVNRMFAEAFSVIITEDNKIIYVKENTNELIVYNKGIKELTYELTDNYKEVKINLTYDDDTSKEILGMYTDYYGFK